MPSIKEDIAAIKAWANKFSKDLDHAAGDLYESLDLHKVDISAIDYKKEKVTTGLFLQGIMHLETTRDSILSKFATYEATSGTKLSEEYSTPIILDRLINHYLKKYALFSHQCGAIRLSILFNKSIMKTDKQEINLREEYLDFANMAVAMLNVHQISWSDEERHNLLQNKEYIDIYRPSTPQAEAENKATVNPESKSTLDNAIKKKKNKKKKKGKKKAEANILLNNDATTISKELCVSSEALVENETACTADPAMQDKPTTKIVAPRSGFFRSLSSDSIFQSVLSKQSSHPLSDADQANLDLYREAFSRAKNDLRVKDFYTQPKCSFN